MHITNKDRGTTTEEKGIEDNDNINTRLTDEEECPWIPITKKVNLNKITNHSIDRSLINLYNAKGVTPKELNPYYTNLGNVIAKIYFKQDSSTLDLNAKHILYAIDITLPSDTTIVVKGYASREGSVDYNKTLSFKRCNSVIKCLRSYEPKKNVIFIADPLGEKGDNTEANRKENRKAELYVIGGDYSAAIEQACSRTSIDEQIAIISKKIIDKQIPEYLLSKLERNNLGIRIKNKQNRFRRGYEEDARCVFALFCNDEDFCTKYAKILDYYIKNQVPLQSENYLTIEFRKEMIQREIIESGLAQYYLKLRKLVLDYTKPMASGKINMYASVPKPFKLIWKDADVFLSAFNN